jgi:hypothetical protein
MTVMGNGNIDVGNQTPTRVPDQPAPARDGRSKPRIDQQNPAKTVRPRVHTAMAQQCCDSGRGIQSAPQKLVHLVGCRDPKARPKPSGRPNPAKT